jgi:hypothetical protein
MRQKNSKKDCSPSGVRAILTDEPVDETGVLLILESMIMPLLKSGASYKKPPKSDSKRAVKSGQEKLKDGNTKEIRTLSAHNFKESA